MINYFNYTKNEGPNEIELHRLTSSKQISIAIVEIKSVIPHLMSTIYWRLKG